MATRRPGSRPFTLANLEPGQAAWFPVPAGQTVANLMQQIGTDIQRTGVACQQELFLAIQPRTREVIELVRVTKLQG